MDKNNLKNNHVYCTTKKRTRRGRSKEANNVGANEEGEKYTYDAKKVARKISNNHDYTNDGKKVVFLTFDDGTSTTSYA